MDGGSLCNLNSRKVSNKLGKIKNKKKKSYSLRGCKFLDKVKNNQSSTLIRKQKPPTRVLGLDINNQYMGRRKEKGKGKGKEKERREPLGSVGHKQEGGHRD